MKLRHLGHSSLLIEYAGKRVLTDPGVFSPAAEKATRVDAVLITHQHPDHVDAKSLQAVLAGSPDARVLAEPQAAEMLKEAGFAVEVLAAGESVELGGSISVRAVGGTHAVIHPDIARVGNVGMVLSAPGRSGERSMAVVGDSLEACPEFQGIAVLAFPIVAPWSKMEETIDFLRETRPMHAVPVHDAVASAEGRAIYIRQATALAPDGTSVVDWPEEKTLEF